MRNVLVQRISRIVIGVVVALAGPVGAGFMALPAEAATLEVGFRDHNYSTSVTAPTGQKPQSKLWFADGRWWGVLWDTPARRFAIHGFNLATQATSAWTSTGVAVDVRRTSQADVLWHAPSQKLYVLTHLKNTDTSTVDQSMKVLRYGYSAGAYTLESSQTFVQQKVEAAVLDRDSTGRLWVTYTVPTAGGIAEVKVVHTTTGDTDWGAPFTVPVPGEAAIVDPDDISTVVAYGDRGSRKIGVLWSNELHSSLYFASHTDGAPDDAWELTALCSTAGCWDDHLNIKSLDADASGNLFAAIKTSLNDAGSPNPDDPLIMVYRLNPDGTWSSSVAWTVGEGDMTRAIVVLDSQNRRVHTFAAGPCCSGGTVYTKDASFDALDFPRGLGAPFIRSATVGESINNPTSTKQTVNGSTGLLVLAGIDTTRDYVHNYLPLPNGDTTAPTVTGMTPAESETPLTTTNVTAVFSEAVAPSTVTGSTFTLWDSSGVSVPASVSYDPTTREATLDPDQDLAPGESYTATVEGGAGGVTDVAGNPLAADHVWSFATSSVVEPPKETVAVPVAEDTYVSDAAPGTNYGTSTSLWVDKKPVQVSYLKFDLSAYAGRALSRATLQLRVADNASTGTQSMRLVDDDSWTELGTTYANRPPLGVALGSFGPTSVGTDYRVALDATVVDSQIGDWLTVGVDTASSDGLLMASGETTPPPSLELVLGPAGPDTTPPTVTGAEPGSGSDDLPVGGNVTATFSERMDPSSIATSTMMLLAGDVTVPATVEYSATARTATLDPVDDLAPVTPYTALVKGGTGGVTDEAGNPMAADYSWTFTTAPPPGQVVSIAPTADTYVSGLKPSVNYGGAAQLSVDNSPAEVTYLRFDLAPFAGRTIENAGLEVTVTDSASKGQQAVRLVGDDSWVEDQVTYATAPARGSTVGTLGPTVRGTTYTVPLDAGLLSPEIGGLLSLGLDSTSRDGIVLGSRETSTTPRLVLELAPQ